MSRMQDSLCPSAQSEKEQAAFISHPYPHSHPQPHTAETLFQIGLRGLDNSSPTQPHLRSRSATPCMAGQKQGHPKSPYYSLFIGQSFLSRKAKSIPWAATHHRVPTPQQGCSSLLRKSGDGKSRTLPLIELQRCGS